MPKIPKDSVAHEVLPKIPRSAAKEDKQETPRYLKPYLSLGVDISVRSDSTQAVGDCPLCGRESRFYVGIEKGLFDCKVCGEKGNVTSFLRKLHTLSETTTTEEDYKTLAQERKILYPSTLQKFGLRRSCITGEWICPGYSSEGKIATLYRYSKDSLSGKKRLLVTAGMTHGIYAPFDTIGFADGPRLGEVKEVYFCEGVWDACAFYETMRRAKRVEGDGNNENRLIPTASVASSLLQGKVVFALPGANVFLDTYGRLTAGKRVTFLYHNDHKREHPPGSGKFSLPGYDGMRRAAKLLAGYEEPPSNIHILSWGGSSSEGYDPSLSNGYDIRDFLPDKVSTATGGKDNISHRVRRLSSLLSLIRPMPSDWLAGRSMKSKKKGTTEIECEECSDFATLIESWRKAMLWTEGLEGALCVMLSSIISTNSVGDQLWCKILSCASSGKSVLCEALSVAKKYVKAKSTIRGFHSGFDSTGKGEEDNSLLSQLKGMTLVTKDGDTLLQTPNLGQVLAEARDIYDRTSRTYYRNKMSKDYNAFSMTWILCGTSSLRQLDSSELGERFLTYSIMDDIDPDLEDEILWRVVNRADRNVSQESNGDAETQQDPAMLRAMQLTGGYVNYLRENANELLSRVTTTDEDKRHCIRLGKFVAYLRARPALKQDEIAEREFAARLVSQFIRIAKCLAAVTGKVRLDEDVLRITTKVALDTAKGRSLDIIRYLYRVGEEGADTRAVAVVTNHTEEKERTLLRFLRKIGAVELFEATIRNIKTRGRWRLTPRLRELYQQVAVKPGS